MKAREMREEIKVSVRIGRNGQKIHPGFAVKYEDGKIGNPHMACGCPYSSRGFTTWQIVAEGWERVTCRFCRP